MHGKHTLSCSGSKLSVHFGCNRQLPSSFVCLMVGRPPPLRNSSGPAYRDGGNGASTDTRNPNTSSWKENKSNGWAENKYIKCGVIKLSILYLGNIINNCAKNNKCGVIEPFTEEFWGAKHGILLRLYATRMQKKNENKNCQFFCF